MQVAGECAHGHHLVGLGADETPQGPAEVLVVAVPGVLGPEVAPHAQPGPVPYLLVQCLLDAAGLEAQGVAAEVDLLLARFGPGDVEALPVGGQGVLAVHLQSPGLAHRLTPRGQLR